MITVAAIERTGATNPKLGLRTAKRRFYTTSLAFLLLTSAGINVLLTREIGGLRDVISHLKAEIGNAGKIQNGQALPTIQVGDTYGKPAAIEFIEESKPAILYVFSPECEWCTRNIENIKALADGTNQRYRLVGLSLSSVGLNDYVARYRVNFPVYTILPSDHSGLRSGTPRTLIVSADGKVLENWFGAYGGELRKRTEQYFQVTLPGVTGDKSPNPDGGNRACE
ncbi:MAG TPA: hypothetical protein VJH03_17980 [Blastocatellia bacterium]|nr:hypothetical protein [Blastocatellia bacterium]